MRLGELTKAVSEGREGAPTEPRHSRVRRPRRYERPCGRGGNTGHGGVLGARCRKGLEQERAVVTHDTDVSQVT